MLWSDVLATFKIVVSTLNAFANVPLFTISGTEVTVTTLITVALILLLTWRLSRFAQMAAERALAHRNMGDPANRHQLKRLIHYVVMVSGGAVAMETVGISLSTLFAAGAVFAVGIGFAMQNIAQNFVSGVILLVERTIKPGDVLEVEGMMVKVQELNIRTTVVRALSGEEVIVPNSVLAQSNVRNFTGSDKWYRLTVDVGVAYGSDMRRVRQVLEQVAPELEWVNSEPASDVLLLGFGASTVDWRVRVWMNDPWSATPKLSALREAVWFALLDADIEIAFPQVDVHFDEPVLHALQRSA